jgi:hypothetical protein
MHGACAAPASAAPPAAAAATITLLLALVAAVGALVARWLRACRAPPPRAARVQAALADPALAVNVTSLLVHTPGGGSLFRGAWHGAPVAVFCSRRSAARRPPPPLPGAGAAHPNVVQLFGVRESVVAGPDAASGALVAPGGAPLSLRAALEAAGAAAPSAPPSSGPEIETVAVLELCELGSLRDAVRVGACAGAATPAGEARRVATLLEVARGLARVHASGVPHGALCPDNVLLAASDVDGRGWVAKVGPPAAALPPAAARGNPRPHAAPEAWVGAPATCAGDVYAFGALAWEVLAGVDAAVVPPPAAGATRAGTPLSPPSAWPCCEAARTLALGCLAPSPAARPTAAQVVRSLAALDDRLRATACLSELDFLFAALRPGGEAAAAGGSSGPPSGLPSPRAAPPPRKASAPVPADGRPIVEDIFFGLPSPH